MSARREIQKRRARLLERQSRLSAETRDLIEKRLQAESPGASQDQAIPRRLESGPVPLSFAQQRLWFIDQWEPGNPLYNIPAALRLGGQLDVAVLKRTLDEIVQRHEILRTRFETIHGQPVQVIAPAVTMNVPLVDLQDLDEVQREAEARRLAAKEACWSFDLARGPLLRVTALRLGVEEHVLLLTVHHIVFDGWSTTAFVRELAALYPDFLDGQPSPLSPLPLQYADYALWQRQWLQGETLEAQLSYWKQQLAGAPTGLQLPADRPRPAVQTHNGATLSFTLSKSLTEALRALSWQESSTLFITLLAAFHTLLHRYTGQQDILVGTPIANRTRAEIEGLIGFFVNTLVIRTRLDGVSRTPTFREFLAQVRRVTLEAHSHQDLPFEMLVEELHLERDMSRTPLFQVMFSLENAPPVAPSLPGLVLSPLQVNGQMAKFDLSLSMMDLEEGLVGEFVYNTNLFDQATIARLAGHLQTLVASIVADPDRRLSDLPLLTGAEEQQLLVEWNKPGKERLEKAHIPHLFEAQVERMPDATAVVLAAGPDQGHLHLTYRELNRRANQLAHHLRALGVGPETIVGLCMERSIEVVTAILGIFKAGGGYAPLDPAYPPQRLAFLLQDTRASVLLTQEELGQRLPTHNACVVCLDSDWPKIARESQENPGGRTLAENVAYVIYTSGSTGQPKGVLISHEAIADYCCIIRNDYQLTPGERLLQFASLTFDASLKQILAPLIAGTTLVLREAEVWAPTDFGSKVLELGLTIINLPPAYWHQLAQEWAVAPARVSAGQLRLVVVGGDVMQPPSLHLWQQTPAKDVRLLNAYGPTETTINATAFDVPSQADLPPGRIPIGRPLANRTAHILDRWGNLVPIGAPGELYIGGGLARGYLRRPGLTAEAFVPNPFSHQVRGERLYRTGDLARYRPDGNIEFLGRIDHQVKVRGFRIEVGEIEAVLGRHPAVREAAVLAASGQREGEDKRLVAYVVPSQGQELAAGDLRRLLQEKLPDYMVPSLFVVLEVLPRTPGGKVDRRALPAPDWSQPEREGAFVAPRTPTEGVLASLWAQVLGVERVGANDNFFELGGHSLLATQVISRLRQAFQVEVSLRALFEAPTVAGLAQHVEATLRAKRGLQAPPLVPVARDGALPLSFAQQRLWFLDQLDPGHATYNMPAALRLTGLLDVAALERSFYEIVRRHQALRTTFPAAGGQPFQVIAPPAAEPLPLVDLGELPEIRQQAEAQRLAAEEAQRPFDLARGPLLRAAVLRLDEKEHVLLVTMHHIVSDGWSVGIFIREIVALYGAFVRGRRSPLPDLPLQYADFAIWQRAWLQGEILETQLSYWKRQLGGDLPALELPADRPRPPVQTFQGASHSRDLPAPLGEALKLLSWQAGCTLFMTLLAAFKVLLYRYTGQADILVGSPIAGRNRSEIEGLIGFFVNTLVLRTDLSRDPSFQEVLSRVREVTLQAYVHQDLPFEKLLEELQPQRDLGRTPLFQVFFNMVNLPGDELELPGLKVEGLSLPQGGSKFDLTLYVSEQGGHVHFDLVYNADLFAPARMAEMLNQFEHLLSQIVTNPGKGIVSYSLVTPTARDLLPDPTTPLRCEPGEAIHAYLSRQTRAIPDRLAVVDKQGAWTYGQLEARSNQLANYLRDNGIQPQDLVAVYGQRSASLVWAVLGILKAGAAFVILDPAYPAARIVDCLRLARPRAWLQLEGAGQLPGALQEFVATLPHASRLVLSNSMGETDASPLADHSMDDPGVAVDPDDVAYLAFTSGSTGKPKGILGTHGPLPHFLRWHGRTFGLDASDRFSMLSGLGHDPLLRDILAPLSLGATLCIPDPECIGTPGWLAAWAKQEGITVAHLTPAMGQLLTETKDVSLYTLRYAFFGGDVLTKHDVFQIRGMAPSITCVNFYGTTETPQAKGYFVVPPGRDDKDWTGARSLIPLGRGIEDVQLLVLNAAQELAGIGELGEIHVRSPYLAKGYLDEDALTGERFIANPFTARPADRLYKTGDLGCYLPDGNVEFRGRADNQVKIRGFRIELQEIETTLAQHPAVREAVVQVLEGGPGQRSTAHSWAATGTEGSNKQLVAYVVAREGQAPTAAELRRFLQEKLADYMLPSAFVTLPALPLTPNGKVDRRALPAPGKADLASAGQVIAPRDTLEFRLTRIWENVLGFQPIGVTQNFFELGGHSLLAVRLMAHIQHEFGQPLPLATLFQAATVERLATTLRQQGTVSSGTSALVLMQAGNSRRRPLFLVHPVGGNVLCYADLVRHLGPRWPVYGLQAPGLYGEEEPHTQMETMAGHYVELLRAVQPEGPYLLGGWSLGGVIAFEMALQLQAWGETVALLALMDAHVLPPKQEPNLDEATLLKDLVAPGGPLDRLPLESGPNQRNPDALSKNFQAELALLAPALSGLGHFEQLGPDEQLKAAFEQARQAQVLPFDAKPDQVRRFVQVVKGNMLAARGYVPHAFPGRVTLFRASEQLDKERSAEDLGWGALAMGGVTVHQVPGDHATLIREPNVRVLAEKLRQELHAS
jgi:amino acid adenylation domain-containing protein